MKIAFFCIFQKFEKWIFFKFIFQKLKFAKFIYQFNSSH